MFSKLAIQNLFTGFPSSCYLFCSCFSALLSFAYPLSIVGATYKLFRSECRSDVVWAATVLKSLARATSKVGAQGQSLIIRTATELVVFTASLLSGSECEVNIILAAAVCRFRAVATSLSTDVCRRNLKFWTATKFATLAVPLK